MAEKMLAIVNRDIGTNIATLSIVSVNGEPMCFGLEDEYRPLSQKVMGETRIGAGRYKVGVRAVGGFHAKYTERFKKDKDIKHQGMLHILDVPGFEYVLIHIGNTEKDTGGCLLLGTTRDQKTMTVGASTDAYKKFYNKVIESALAGLLEIEFQDNDRK